jgi:ferric-dicitrate binding protein FerR (iron transport regulator)
MSTCEHLSDRMPGVATGGVQWSAEDAAHLQACPDCEAEWKLVQGAARLGTRLPRPDPEAMAAGILGRIQTARRDDARRRRAVRAGGLAGLAAAAALLVSVLVRQPQGSGGDEGSVPSPGLELPLAELDDATDAELRDVLAEFDPPISEGQFIGPGLDRMSGVDIERALSAWEEG